MSPIKLHVSNLLYKRISSKSALIKSSNNRLKTRNAIILPVDDTLQFRPYDKRRHGSHVTNTDKCGSD